MKSACGLVAGTSQVGPPDRPRSHMYSPAFVEASPCVGPLRLRGAASLGGWSRSAVVRGAETRPCQVGRSVAPPKLGPVPANIAAPGRVLLSCALASSRPTGLEPSPVDVDDTRGPTDRTAANWRTGVPSRASRRAGQSARASTGAANADVLFLMAHRTARRRPCGTGPDREGKCTSSDGGGGVVGVLWRRVAEQRRDDHSKKKERETKRSRAQRAGVGWEQHTCPKRKEGADRTGHKQPCEGRCGPALLPPWEQPPREIWATPTRTTPALRGGKHGGSIRGERGRRCETTPDALRMEEAVPGRFLRRSQRRQGGMLTSAAHSQVAHGTETAPVVDIYIYIHSYLPRSVGLYIPMGRYRYITTCLARRACRDRSLTGREDACRSDGRADSVRQAPARHGRDAASTRARTPDPDPRTPTTGVTPAVNWSKRPPRLALRLACWLPAALSWSTGLSTGSECVSWTRNCDKACLRRHRPDPCAPTTGVTSAVNWSSARPRLARALLLQLSGFPTPIPGPRQLA